jgi:hypothetical protein
MLKGWADSGAYRSILARCQGEGDDQLIEVVKIEAFELADEGESTDLYVIVTDVNRQLLRTRHALAFRDAHWKGFEPSGRHVDQPRAFRDW